MCEFSLNTRFFGGVFCPPSETSKNNEKFYRFFEKSKDLEKTQKTQFVFCLKIRISKIIKNQLLKYATFVNPGLFKKRVKI